ncbi:MAG: DNA replication/repair protein RecF, partial [Vulcanimicrobiaceae bacterium]
MRLLRLELCDLRNYAELLLEPAPGLNLFVGPNAQGKSNLLEAIGLLATGRSFRTIRERELVRYECERATVAGEAALRSGPVRVLCELCIGGAGVRKRYALNGAPVRHARYLGAVRAVGFAARDLALVSGPPALRRGLLNLALSQLEPGYYAALVRYNRALAQKNTLLRTAERPEAALLASYDEQLAGSGGTVGFARSQFVAELAGRVAAVHRAWLGQSEGELEVRYESNAGSSARDAAAASAALAGELAAQREAER